jgi:hypothetical protein
VMKDESVDSITKMQFGMGGEQGSCRQIERRRIKEQHKRAYTREYTSNRKRERNAEPRCVDVKKMFVGIEDWKRVGVGARQQSKRTRYKNRIEITEGDREASNTSHKKQN